MSVTVKYKQQKYKVSLLEAIHVLGIKTILFIKRNVRRAKIVIPQNALLYMLLSACWVCFGVFTYYFGQVYKAPDSYTIVNVIWDLKNPYFTSVVLALFITGYNQVVGYKEKLIQQHDFYCKCMEVFDDIFVPFIEDKRYNYMVFYNNLCLESTISYIMNEVLWNAERLNAVQESIDEILEFLKYVDDKRKNKCILGVKSEYLEYEIEFAQKQLKDFKKLDTLDAAMEAFEDVTWSLMCVVDDLRRPWRWDIDNNLKILKILDKKESNEIKEDFYYNMHLYGYDLYSEDE